MIKLTFYGTKFLGKHRQTNAERAVIAAWREYLDHFSNLPPNPSDDVLNRWTDSGIELFVTLLEKMTITLNYEFDRMQIKKGAYSPLAHGRLEAEQQELRGRTIDLLAGRAAIKIEVVNLPRASGNPAL